MFYQTSWKERASTNYPHKQVELMNLKTNIKMYLFWSGMTISSKKLLVISSKKLLVLRKCCLFWSGMKISSKKLLVLRKCICFGVE